MVVYIDVLFVTNFIISYFLLLTSSLVSGYTFSRIRILISSVTGALLCLMIFLNINNVLLSISIKISTLLICATIAFGLRNKRGYIIQTVWYFLLNMLLTGVVILVSVNSNIVLENNMFFYFSINPVLMVVSSVVIYIAILVCELVKEHISPQRLYRVNIVFKEFSIKEISAFYDSGFKIKDIVSNKDVIIASYKKLKDNIPEYTVENIKSFLAGEYSAVVYGFVPVFFKTVSGEGMLPAIKAEYLEVANRKIKNILVAFTDNELSENVDVIFGDDIKKQI